MGKWLSLILCGILLMGLLTSCMKAEVGMDMDSSYPNEAPMSPEAGFDGATGTVDKSEIGDSLQGDDSEGETLKPKIIKTAEVNAETKLFDATLTKIEEMVEAKGGYVESSSIRGNHYGNERNNRHAEYTLRIPADQLDAFLADTGEQVHVINTSTSATDISGEYYDIEARLSVLETERQVLEKMLSQTTNVTNMISIEQRLYDVIYEIESYKSMLKVYDGKVAYSTVHMTLWEVEDLTVVKESNTFGGRFKTAVKESWQDFAEFCKDFVIGFVYALPTLLVLGAIAAILTCSIVFSVKRRRKKKQRKAAEEQTAE
jgi:hypothetical protein